MSKNVESVNNGSMYDVVVAKIKSFLKVDDDSKLGAQVHQLVKHYKGQIREANSQIDENNRKLDLFLEDAEEKLEELKHEEDEAFMKMDLDRVQSIESRKKYVKDLDKQFTEAIKARVDFQESIEETKERNEKANEGLKKQISDWEYKISKFVTKK